MILTTDRLHLRCMEPRDIDPFVRALNDWEVQQWLAQPPFPYRREHGEAYLAIVRANHAGPHPTVFVAADKASDAALGAVAIDIDNTGVGVLGYWFARDQWGRGLAREAMQALVGHALGHPALRQLFAVTDPANLRSQRVLAAVGFADAGLHDRPSPSRRGAMQLRRYEFPLAPR